MKTIITILDGITETSMPFNEFTIYRANAFHNEKNILIIFGTKKKLPKVQIPDSLKIYYADSNINKLKNIVKKVILNETDKDGYVIHLHQVKSGFATQLALLFTKYKKYTVFTVHSTYPGYSIHNKILSISTAVFSKYITCVSNTSYEKYPKIIKIIKKDRIVAIQNGVDTKRIDSRKRSSEYDNHKEVIFAYVARIIPIKNQDFLINVIKNTKSNTKFVFIGNDDSTYAKIFKEKCRQNKIEDRITITGLISRSEVYDYLQKSDVYISTSRLEGMPISVLEAAYIGLPLIISDIQQHRELAKNEKNISILPFDTDSWISEINLYASMPIKERKKIGASCKKYVYENYSLDKMHNNYTNLYEKILGIGR